MMLRTRLAPVTHVPSNTIFKFEGDPVAVGEK
jgi:hypothetical protein